jgi:hypothetical protein
MVICLLDTDTVLIAAFPRPLAPPARLSSFLHNSYVHGFSPNDIHRGRLLFEDVDGVTRRVTYDEDDDQVAVSGISTAFVNDHKRLGKSAGNARFYR